MHCVHISESAAYAIPSTWEELTAAQLKKIAWILTLKKEPADLAKLIFLALTLSLPWWKRLRLWWFYFHSSTIDEKADLLRCTLSFTENRKITEQKIKKICWTFVPLYGPDSSLANSTLWEYIKAEQYFINYQERKEQIWLDKLVATLYRPKKSGYNPQTDTDIRIPLTDMSVRFRLRQVERIDQSTKLAILMWFDGCRHFIIQSFPTIFQKPEPKKAGPLAALSKPSGRSGWMGLISELAGGMQHYDAIGNTNLYTALTDISHRIQKANETKRKPKR